VRQVQFQENGRRKFVNSNKSLTKLPTPNFHNNLILKERRNMLQGDK